MFRRSPLVYVLIVIWIAGLSACSKKQTVAADSGTEVVTPPTAPPVEEPFDDQSGVDDGQVSSEPIPALDDVFFDYDKSALSSDARHALENNARQLKDATSVSIIIEGHCDERGTNAYNLALGEKRAKAAASFLTSLGVSSSRIRTVTKGEEQPFDSGHGEAAWAKNRRAHFKISN